MVAPVHYENPRLTFFDCMAGEPDFSSHSPVIENVTDTVYRTDIDLNVGIIAQRRFDKFRAFVMRGLVFEIHRRSPTATDIIASFASDRRAVFRVYDFHIRRVFIH